MPNKDQLLNERDCKLLNNISEVYGATKALMTFGFDVTDIIVERNACPVIWVGNPTPAQCDLFPRITIERLVELKDKDADSVTWGEFRGMKVMWDFAEGQPCNGDYRMTVMTDLRKEATA